LGRFWVFEWWKKGGFCIENGGKKGAGGSVFLKNQQREIKIFIKNYEKSTKNKHFHSKIWGFYYKTPEKTHFSPSKSHFII
jgi:hypothetical protein